MATVLNGTNGVKSEQQVDVERLMTEIQKLNERQDRLLVVVQKALKIEAPAAEFSESDFESLKPIPEDYDSSAVSTLSSYRSSQEPDQAMLTWLCDMFLAELKIQNVGLYKPNQRRASTENQLFSTSAIEFCAFPRLILHEPKTVLPWYEYHINEVWSGAVEQLRDLASKVKERWPVDLALSLDNPDWLRPVSSEWLAFLKPGITYNRSGWPIMCKDVKEQCPWGKSEMGRIWAVLCNEAVSTLSFKTIALILAQLSINKQPQRRLAVEFALLMLRWFVSEWPLYASPVLCRDIDTIWIHLQYHLRFCSHVGSGELSNKPSTKDGLLIDRDIGQLNALGQKYGLRIREGRFSVAINTSVLSGLPIYTIVYLTDKRQPLKIFHGLELTESGLDANKMQKPGTFAGVAVFQHLIRQALDFWKDDWTKVLDSIDALINIDIRDVVSPIEREMLMFDESLARSRLYFSVQQLLRIFSEWINDGSRALSELSHQWEHTLQKYLEREGPHRAGRLRVHGKVISSNWQVLCSLETEMAKLLLDQMRKREEIVKSLQDGLFNATSVREATKATTLNRYIFVFTVTTIFFLPLGFVATLFGMHLFDKEDPKQNQVSFFISTILVSLITWAFSLVALWGIYRHERGGSLKRMRQDNRSGNDTENWLNPGYYSDPRVAAEAKGQKTGNLV